MQLVLQSQETRDAVIVRSRGRIVTGEEAKFLQSEIERLTQLTKNVVLQLAEVNYIDSGGVGTLVRLLGMLRAARGDLKLCQLSPFVRQVLQATNLLSVFHPYSSEQEAIEAFSARTPAQAPVETSPQSSSRVVCLDNSQEVLALLKVLLQRSGYEVFATRYASDAVALVLGARPCIVVCGPGMSKNEMVLEKLRESVPDVPVLHLPPDFSTSEADRAGPELVERVRSLLGPAN